MKNVVTTLALLASLTTAVVGANDKKPSAPVRAGFPALVISETPQLDRFNDADYFKLLAADGLHGVDPKVLFARMAAAAQAGENYKALYLSRIFTAQQPDNAAGWANRARLAAQLGFAAEAAAAQANAQSGARPVPGGALPGAMKVRPASLSDWAAALALVADDVTALEGRPMVVAVKDDLSGVQVPNAREIEERGDGPFVTAKPVQVEDVLPNMFVMPTATPMDGKSLNGGMFALGALALAGSAYSANIGATDAGAMFSELAGKAGGRASEVPSTFKGGAYVAKTFASGAPAAQNLAPKTAGKYHAVGTPLAMLWATGSSLEPTVNAAWRNGDSPKTLAKKLEVKNAGKNARYKKHQVPALAYPRLQRFCDAGRCSPMLTLLEVMLTDDDLNAFAPAAVGSVPSLAHWRFRYDERRPMSVVDANGTFTGTDAAGNVYVTTHQPTQWLTTAAPGKR